jgi:hypothetical protein
MGVTMNHIAAVTVPISGAWLWVRYQNYQIPFWVGVGIAVLAYFATRCLPREARAPSPRESMGAEPECADATVN